MVSLMPNESGSAIAAAAGSPFASCRASSCQALEIGASVHIKINGSCGLNAGLYDFVISLQRHGAARTRRLQLVWIRLRSSDRDSASIPR
jgi:hypothetical protein